MGFREYKSSGHSYGRSPERASTIYSPCYDRGKGASSVVRLGDGPRVRIVLENQVRILAWVVVGQVNSLGREVDGFISRNRVCRRKSFLGAVDGARQCGRKRTVNPDRQIEILSVLRLEDENSFDQSD